MSNRILDCWEGVVSARRGGAIFSPSGDCLREWAEIEAEARGFYGEISVARGVVALQTGNHPSFPALVLACLRSGREIALFDAGFLGDARSRIENRLGVSLRVSARGGELRFEQSGGGAGEPSGACLHKLTSGTTALPAPIGFTADQLVADCDQVCGTMGVGADDVNYGVVAFTHSYGFSSLVTPLLCRGTRLVVADDSLPRAMESGLKHSGATVLPAVPAIFRGLLAADALPGNLRLCISAGAPLDPGVARQFQEKFGRKIHAFYGASECGGICYDASEDPVDAPGYVGEPLHGVRIECSGQEGGSKIVVRSAAVGAGAAGADGGFRPADLLVREGRGFRIVGRESDLINVAGRKANPLEIEGVIEKYPGVCEAAVCGVEDEARGQEICALVAASNPLDAALLRRHCAAHLAPWKVPRRIAFVAEIPRNARGKISRAEAANTFF